MNVLTKLFINYNFLARHTAGPKEYIKQSQIIEKAIIPMFSVNNVSSFISLSAYDIVGVVIRASSALLIKILLHHHTRI